MQFLEGFIAFFSIKSHTCKKKSTYSQSQLILVENNSSVRPKWLMAINSLIIAMKMWVCQCSIVKLDLIKGGK